MENNVFELINLAEKYGENSITTIVKDNEPWFKGKDVATILGYKDHDYAIRTHVIHNCKSTIFSLHIGTPGEMSGVPGGEKNTIYINEAGLYQLIMRSKLPSAVAFQLWVTSELLPKVRKIGQERLLKELSEAKTELQEQKDQLNRLHLVQRELLSYKKRVTKEETIYIVSTANYARQGVFKIGRTKQKMNFRNAAHNVTHVAGDKVRVLHECRVHDSVLLENVIHSKLKGLLLDGEREFFMCPFDLLANVVDSIVENDNGENEQVNLIIDAVYRLKTAAFDTLDWTAGIPEDAFKEKLTISDGEQVRAEMDVSTWPEEEKDRLVADCLKTFSERQERVLWKSFRKVLETHLPIPKSKFKTGDWKDAVKRAASSQKVSITWRDREVQP
jgi:prophage antirepressor-like protein